MTAAPSNQTESTADPLGDDLTEPQREAVLHTEGPLLVLAAAGSGKTRVITRRVVRLIHDGVPPWAILAVTFTNKAAAEMRERVHHLLLGENSDADPYHDRRTRGLMVTTFHSLCARLLRKYADMANLPGLKSDYSVYATADQTALMKRTIQNLNLETSNWRPRDVLGVISNAKNELLGPTEYAAQAADFYAKHIAKIYEEYERAKRQANAVDFDDLLLLTVRMLRDNAEIRSECQRRWSFLMIDEYQDTNGAQFEIARLLAGTNEERGPRGPNICVVGDPDQAIYGWRGADLRNILDFESQYPGTRVITLGENFRSTAPILAVADHLIRHNKQRKHKDLFTSTPGGDPVEVVYTQDERHEARLVADRFRHRAEDGASWRDMAVFYRTNALSRVIEDELRASGIPYTIARGTAFFEREEVKNAVAYLRAIANPLDDVSLARIINTPARGIGSTSLKAVQAFADRERYPLWDALVLTSRGEGPDVSSRAANAIAKFIETVESWTGAGSFMGAEISGSLADLVERVIEESTLRAYYQKQADQSGHESDEDRLDNLDELISSAAEFEENFDPAGDPFAAIDILESGDPVEVPPLLALLRGYLEQIALVADADTVDPERGSVTLMTLHAAKGLEFQHVAMIGLEDGTLPHSRARESESQMEEERRLAFVGITRARKELMITNARYRSVRGLSERTMPSRFLEELPGEHVTVSDQADPIPDRPSPSRPGASGKDRGDGLVVVPDAWAEAESAHPSGGLGADRWREAFPPGSSVRHPQFGFGRIVNVTGGAHAKARVRFRDAGEKTLILEYARLTRLAD